MVYIQARVLVILCIYGHALNFVPGYCQDAARGGIDRHSRSRGYRPCGYTARPAGGVPRGGGCGQPCQGRSATPTAHPQRPLDHH